MSQLFQIKEKLKHFQASDHEIVTPVQSVIAYLKKIQCPKDIFCIGGHVLRDTLKQAGYNIITMEVSKICRYSLQ